MVECWFHMNPFRGPHVVHGQCSFKMETRANVFLFLSEWRGRAAMGGAGRFFCATKFYRLSQWVSAGTRIRCRSSEIQEGRPTGTADNDRSSAESNKRLRMDTAPVASQRFRPQSKEKGADCWFSVSFAPAVTNWLGHFPLEKNSTAIGREDPWVTLR